MVMGAQVFEKRSILETPKPPTTRAIILRINPDMAEKMSILGVSCPRSGYVNGMHQFEKSWAASDKGILLSTDDTKNNSILSERSALAYALIQTAISYRAENLSIEFDVSCKVRVYAHPILKCFTVIKPL